MLSGVSGICGGVILTGKIGAVPSNFVSIRQGTKLITNNTGEVKRQPIHKEVDEDWYQALHQGKQALAEASKEVLGVEGVSGTTLSAPQKGGRNARITVDMIKEVTTEATTLSKSPEDNIPAQINGVEVLTNQVSKGPELGLCYTNPTNPPEAGVEVETKDGAGSLGGRAYKNGNYRYMTCEHLWTNNPGDLLVNGTVIGQAVDWDCHDDFAALAPRNGWYTTDGIAGTSASVSAQMSADGIWEIEGYNSGTGPYMHKQGRTTCHTSGPIAGIGDAIVYNSNCNFRDHQVKWGHEWDFDPGDSGSLGYVPDYDGEDWACCLNAANSNRVFGTGCYHIEDLHGYHWL